MRFGRETVEGLRIRPAAVRPKEKKELTPANQKMWQYAIDAYKRDGNLDAVEARVLINEENRQLLIQQAEQS